MMPRAAESAAADHSLISSTTAAAELAYERSTAAILVTAKDEDVRKLLVQVQLLLNDNCDLKDELYEERFRTEDATSELDACQTRMSNLSLDFDRLGKDLASKTTELNNAMAEIKSLRNMSDDSSKILKEKLALERELANVKPELEHLRSTTTTNQSYLAEKLALERQLGTAKTELEDVKQALDAARTRQNKSNSRDAEHEAEVADLQKRLAKAEREILRAAKKSDADEAARLAELEKLLSKETTARENAEAALSSANARAVLGGDVQLQLEDQKQQKTKLEEQLQKAEGEWNAEKAALDDKLNQFRTKLRSTKEKLKETENELVETRTAHEKASKNNRKRSAVQMDPHAAIGTPGDGVQAKRNKLSVSSVGEKSTFSITPFLNKRTSAVPDDTQADEPIASVEDTNSPLVAVSAADKKKPLAPSSPGKSNPKIKAAPAKKSAAKVSLVSVPEEDEEEAENESPAAVATVEPSVVASAALAKKPNMSLKPRKTLESFASFRDASLPPQPLQKKKRKLGGPAKTLFDEDEEDDVGIGGLQLQRPFGAFGGGVGGGIKRGNALGGTKVKGSRVVADGGFTFSPLKRNPRAAAPPIRPTA